MNPISAIFAAGVALRNALYDRGVFKVHKLARPVVSIGNISVGGSGKTPFVIALGEYVASVLVFVPANRPISIAIASELRDFNLGAAAAYGVVLIVIISVSMVIAGKLERTR